MRAHQPVRPYFEDGGPPGSAHGHCAWPWPDFSAEPAGRIIPEIRSNLGYALPGASEPVNEVAAVPGRITQIGDRVVAFAEPAFSASRHVAKVILAAMPS